VHRLCPEVSQPQRLVWTASREAAEGLNTIVNCGSRTRMSGRAREAEIP
jgi:hypothetical protein